MDNIDKKICSYTNKDKPEDIVSGYYLRCRMGKAGAEICEADVITHYKTKLEPGLVLKNYIEIPEERIEKSKIHYDEAIEDQFGGSPDLDNLVSQRSDLNRAVKNTDNYRSMEREWSNALKNGQNVTDVDIKLSYKNGSSRPSSFNVSYKIDGELFRRIFKQ